MVGQQLTDSRGIGLDK